MRPNDWSPHPRIKTTTVTSRNYSKREKQRKHGEGKNESASQTVWLAPLGSSFSQTGHSQCMEQSSERARERDSVPSSATAELRRTLFSEAALRHPGPWEDGRVVPALNDAMLHEYLQEWRYSSTHY
jgi:hypothetical protein